MAYTKITSQLLAIAGDDKTTAEQALEAGAFDIDTAFAQAGYAVPVDPTQATDATVQTRLAAKLAEVNRAKAAFLLSSGSSRGRKGQSTVIQKDWKACEEWLKKVAERDVVIPGLPSAADPSGLAGGGVTGFAVATPTTAFNQKRVDDVQRTLDFLVLSESGGVHI